MKRDTCFLKITCASILVASAMVPGPTVAETSTAVNRRVAFDCTSASVGGADEMFSDVAQEISRKWNWGAASPEVLKSEVTVRVCFSEDGRPDQMILIAADGPTYESVDRLFQAARRAILRAVSDGGLPLSPDKYDTWRVLDLVFDANGMTLR